MCGLSLVRRVFAVSLIVLSAGCGGSSAPTPTPTSPSPSAPSVASVAVTGPASLTAAGQTSQLTATATMSDSTTQNVTNSATWQSSNQAVMTVSGVGLVTATAAGQATITATTQGRSGTLAMSVVLPVTTTFEGSVAGGAGPAGQSGAFRASIQSPVSAAAVHPLAVVGASGTLTLINGGGTSILAGTFDTVTNSMSLSGGGFALTGTVGQGAFTGTYTGPASTNGAFAGLNSTGTTVTVMCGTYSGTDTGSGIWNLQVAASGAASGVTRPNFHVTRDPQPRSSLLTGQLTGNTLTLRSVDIRPDGSTFTATATGTVQGTSVTGTHDNGQGTFSGSAAACR